MVNGYLGYQAEDRITGFRGTITGYVEYITGCNQLLLAPRSEDGKADPQWYDVQRVEIDRVTPRLMLPGNDAGHGANDPKQHRVTGPDRPAPVR